MSTVQAQHSIPTEDFLRRIERLIVHRRAERARRLATRSLGEGRASAPLRTLLGRALAACGDLSGAAEQYDEALGLDPAFAPARLHRGLLRLSQGDVTRALDDVSQAHALDPTHPDTLLALWQCERSLCIWRDRRPRLAELALTPPPRFLFPPALARDLWLRPAEYRTTVLRWNEALHQRLARAPRARRAIRDFTSQRPLRIAYLTNFAHLPLLTALVVKHESERVHPRIYLSDGKPTGTFTNADIVAVNALKPWQAAQAIADAETDILVDLCGDSCSHAETILALRPAPVQVRWLGPPGTSGAPHVDWLLTDVIATPAVDSAAYTERLAYLPVSAWAVDGDSEAAPASELETWLQASRGMADPAGNTAMLKDRLRQETASRRTRRFVAEPNQGPASANDSGASCGHALRQILRLPTQGIIFGSLLTAERIAPELFATWLRVLQRIPEGWLWLPSVSPAAQHNLRVCAGEAASRIVFLPEGLALPTLPPLRQALLQLADVYLATDGDEGGCADALLAEIPPVALAMAGRTGRLASLMAAAGLDHLLVTSLADYEEHAVHLASEGNALETQQVRIQLNRLVAPLFQNERTVRNVEEALHLIWAAFLECRHIARIDVPDVGDGAPAGTLPAPGQVRPSTLARRAMLAYLGGSPAAETLCKQALLHNLHDPLALELLALQALDKGQPEVADRLLRRALTTAQRPDSLAYLGAALIMQGRLDEANHAHQRAQLLKPQLAAPLATLRNDLAANTPWPTVHTHFRCALQQHA